MANKTKCNRCGKKIDGGVLANTCWYCHKSLCDDCWDKYGHCGHKEADKFNAKAKNQYKIGVE